VHGFVPTRQVGLGERLGVQQRILAAFGWPRDSFVVGACGGPGWRKGSDLYLQIACRLHRSHGAAAMRFLWVGGGAGADAEALQFAHDLHALGLERVCERVASTADVDAYYCAMDVFALTSREDPFPLVMLEAGLHGLPTVCFAGAGGGPEFVAADAGIVVPYLDLDRFADAVKALREDPTKRKTLGEGARRKVRQHHGVETQGPKLLRSIERCLASSA
jgi:glycosyltransferase involved in cell wall biosynthesis